MIIADAAIVTLMHKPAFFIFTKSKQAPVAPWRPLSRASFKKWQQSIVIFHISLENCSWATYWGYFVVNALFASYLQLFSILKLSINDHQSLNNAIPFNVGKFMRNFEAMIIGNSHGFDFNRQNITLHKRNTSKLEVRL